MGAHRGRRQHRLPLLVLVVFELASASSPLGRQGGLSGFISNTLAVRNSKFDSNLNLNLNLNLERGSLPRGLVQRRRHRQGLRRWCTVSNPSPIPPKPPLEVPPNTDTDKSPVSVGMEPRKAERMAMHASVAYCDESDILDWKDPIGYTSLIPGFDVRDVVKYPKTDTWCYLGVSEKEREIIVSFRGSGSLSAFQTNLKLNLVDLELPELIKDRNKPENAVARVHEGFLETSTGIFPELVTKVEGIVREYPDFQLIFTGHSLGAANAILTGYFFAEKHQNWRPLVLAFAPPRVGNAEFRRAFHQRFFEIDSVTQASPGGLGQEKSGDVTVGVYTSENEETRGRAWGFVHSLDPVLHYNQRLWDTLLFESVGTEMECSPESFYARATSDSVLSWIPPLNILDHCRYLGIYMGPRLPGLPPVS